MRKKRTYAILSLWLCLSLPGWAMGELIRGDFTPSKIADETAAWYTSIAYTIQAGDTLWDLSRRYQVELDALLASNNLRRESILRIGQSVNIPAPGTMIHQVQSGESLWSIARSYGLGMQDLLDLNRGLPADQIMVGEYIQIPDQARSIATLSPSRGVLLNCIWPLQGTISSYFGNRKSGYHHGLDIVGSLGDTIKAAASGRVSYVGYHDIYGNMVIIDHGNGYETLYAHLRKNLISQGDYVATGARVGEVGVTGRTTGPHLHFEVRYQGEPQNPSKYLK